jgi:antirestriction protein ArdC
MVSNNGKDEILERLVDGIGQLTTSQRWQEYLAVQSRFHRYSFGNTLLIHLQCHEATRIAGFHAWRKLGRNVRKGEKAIWILAPVTRKASDEPSDDTATDAKVRTLVAFKPAAVFDISQTDGEELPEVVTRLEGDDVDDAFTRLAGIARGLGYTVEEDYLHGPNGVCNYTERRITIEVGNQPVQQVKTLVHEIAHAILHEDSKDRALAELEAESVAYVVCAVLGIDSGDYTFGYVTTWAGGGDEAIAGIRAAGTRIQRTANDIVSQLEAADAASSVAA